MTKKSKQNYRRKAPKAPNLGLTTRLVRSRDDPPTTAARAVFSRCLMMDQTFGSVTAGKVTFTPAQIAIAEGSDGGTAAARFGEFRIQKIEVWGAAVLTSGNTVQGTITLQLADVTSDSASFIDYGVFGKSRPKVAVIPNLQMREHWFDSTDTGKTLFVVNDPGLPSGSTASGLVVIRLTLQLR